MVKKNEEVLEKKKPVKKTVKKETKKTTDKEDAKPIKKVVKKTTKDENKTEKKTVKKTVKKATTKIVKEETKPIKKVAKQGVKKNIEEKVVKTPIKKTTVKEEKKPTVKAANKEVKEIKPVKKTAQKKTIKSEPKKEEKVVKANDELDNIKREAGLVLIFVAIICLIILLFSSGIWFSTIDFTGTISKFNGTISSTEKKAVINVDDINEEVLFESTYYDALNKLSNTIGYGSTWLDICPNSQREYNNKIYVRICSDEYKSKDDIINSLTKQFTVSFINLLMGDYYIDIDYQENSYINNSKLYIYPISLEKDPNYIEMDSYEMISKTSEKIEYEVTSKYKVPFCKENCNYVFKTNKFVLVNVDGNWLVDNMELPY